jgi:hypothetical protein
MPTKMAIEKRGYLFPSANLAKVFRAKWLQAAGNAGLRVHASIAKDWVVDCKSVGSGQKALVYLGRYLYRGVLPEKDILSDRDGLVTFRIRDNTSAVLIQSVAGAEFLWMLLRHVLPKRFRRAVLQLLLHVMLPEPRPPQPRPPIYCPLCGGVIEIVAVRVRESSPAPG